jgi:hypothetical protein
MTLETHQMNGLMSDLGRGTMESLGEALPKEQARVREVLGHYKEIGAPGRFGVMMIEQSLKKADQAIMSGDVAAMITAFKELQEIKD